MSDKYKCKDIWSLWDKGWICIPTAPDNTEDRFPTDFGRYMVSRFPGLEKNYNRICDADKGPYAVFRSTFSKVEENCRLLVYHDPRDPLSPGDNGLILLPDMAGGSDNQEEDAETDWEVIEKTAIWIKENRKLIPGPIFVPPLGYGKDRMEEDDAVDDLMALLIDVQDVYVIYDIPLLGEDEQKESEDEKEEVDSTPPPDFGSEKEEPELQENIPGGSLIQDEFETIEVKLP